MLKAKIITEKQMGKQEILLMEILHLTLMIFYVLFITKNILPVRESKKEPP